MKTINLALVICTTQCGGAVLVGADPDVAIVSHTFACSCEQGTPRAWGTVDVRYTAGDDPIVFDVASVAYVDWTDAGVATNRLSVQFTPMTSGLLVAHESVAVSHVIQTLPDAHVCAISGGVDLVVEASDRTWELAVPSTPDVLCPD